MFGSFNFPGMQQKQFNDFIILWSYFLLISDFLDIKFCDKRFCKFKHWFKFFIVDNVQVGMIWSNCWNVWFKSWQLIWSIRSRNIDEKYSHRKWIQECDRLQKLQIATLEILWLKTPVINLSIICLKPFRSTTNKQVSWRLGRWPCISTHECSSSKQ